MFIRDPAFDDPIARSYAYSHATDSMTTRATGTMTSRATGTMTSRANGTMTATG
jgi:hypothetical protein